jgi:alpha-glucosidase (family GH31 glycosyl hydrolase)
MHNINGHMQLITSFNALVNSKKWSETGKRPIIFSDSTWAGSGHYGAVALTNMWRDWSSLRNSIAMAMSFSMYGVSNVASDVCGNAGPIDEELCGRWA